MEKAKGTTRKRLVPAMEIAVPNHHQTARETHTIKDVIFDIGDAKCATKVDAHMKVLIAHIHQSKVYGDYLQEMADALSKEVPDTIRELLTTDKDYKNPHDKDKNPSDCETATELLKMKYQQN